MRRRKRQVFPFSTNLLPTPRTLLAKSMRMWSLSFFLLLLAYPLSLTVLFLSFWHDYLPLPLPHSNSLMSRRHHRMSVGANDDDEHLAKIDALLAEDDDALFHAFVQSDEEDDDDDDDDEEWDPDA